MTTPSTGHQLPSAERRRAAGEVDFTFMYAAHDAFRRDLRRLASAAAAGQAEDPAVRAGWKTFRHQMHIHHTAEDRWLWPAVRAKATTPGEASVLDAMEAEHLRIDPLLVRVDAALAASGTAGLAEAASALAAALTAHMDHEEEYALPVVAARIGARGWAGFGQTAGKSEGLQGAAEMFPWMLDGAPAAISQRLLAMLPLPARLLYRARWRPRYAGTPRWAAAAS